MKRRLDDLSPESRLAIFRKDARLLDRLTKVVHKKALEADDNTAWGHLALKCLERRASMYGTDAPSRVDMAVVAEELRWGVRAKFFGVRDSAQPLQQGFRNRCAESKSPPGSGEKGRGDRSLS